MYILLYYSAKTSLRCDARFFLVLDDAWRCSGSMNSVTEKLQEAVNFLRKGKRTDTRWET